MQEYSRAARAITFSTSEHNHCLAPWQRPSLVGNSTIKDGLGLPAAQAQGAQAEGSAQEAAVSRALAVAGSCADQGLD